MASSIIDEYLDRPHIGWRWVAALWLFLFALLGMMSGVSLTERPDVISASLLTKAYYSLGLFVVGGLDLGTPVQGPLWGRAMLWIAYFGAPLLTASAVIEAVIRVISPNRWQLRRLEDHIIIFGSGELTISFLRVIRKHHNRTKVVVVDKTIPQVRRFELQDSFKARVVIGDITNEFLLKELRVRKARKVMLLGDDNFECYEAASKIINNWPAAAPNIILHCYKLRFLRAMQDTQLAKQCVNFNAYHLAATGLVQNHLIREFERTEQQDVVVMGGFGRFGQTVLEEIENRAEREIQQVAVIDTDADRRILVVEEQNRLAGTYPRVVYQGDVSNPEVWRNLGKTINLAEGAPIVILGTGKGDENLRTALWVKKKFPNTTVFARTNDRSNFALEVAKENGINSMSITELVEESLPLEWLSQKT